MSGSEGSHINQLEGIIRKAGRRTKLFPIFQLVHVADCCDSTYVPLYGFKRAQEVLNVAWFSLECLLIRVATSEEFDRKSAMFYRNRFYDLSSFLNTRNFLLYPLLICDFLHYIHTHTHTHVCIHSPHLAHVKNINVK